MICYACAQRFRQSSVCLCDIPHVDLMLDMLRAIDRAKAKRAVIAQIEIIKPSKGRRKSA